MGNAIKFTDKGDVDLYGQVLKKDGRYQLTFAVSDTGPGIREDDLEKIFEEFEQGETGRSAGGGNGLGLSIAKRLAEALDGKLTVHSTLGFGTTFKLVLSVDEARETRIPQPSETKLQFKESLNILVAEDNSVNQMVTRGILEHHGHTAVIAVNGQEAFSLAVNTPRAFDLVLMDIQMPVMNGLEATKKIRAQTNGIEDIPIIALTANAFEEQRIEYLDAGVDDVLIKPIRIEHLSAIVNRISNGLDVRNISRDVDNDNLTAPSPDPTYKAVVESRLINRLVFDRMLANFSTDMVSDFLNEALASAANLITDMRNLGDDHPAIRKKAHELRGLLSNFGFHAAIEITRTIRNLDPQSEKFTRTLDDLEVILESTTDAAREILSTTQQNQAAKSK